ncbi:MAG: 3-deoxy-manno-octulosonate cytidylyltransferase [Planctomycetes bacterium RIFCSPLOWO2_12_FULL_50_35]|nr:MAG: 3-deoxy-manno-octulosonate cytidylyltransferase [Planctomycetes bacterium RIFCSPLOWO2_12_FULL_50_35]
MKAYAVIPARYGSTRLPGKCILPEAKAVTGKYIIEHVYSRTKEAKRIEGVVVATDDQRIYDVVKGFGGCAKMTSPSHNSGTERVAEVVKDLDSDIDIIVNVQGDEPEVRPDMVDTVVAALINDPKTVMSTLANPIISRNELNNPHAVKVVMDNNGYALYFSRSPIPYSSNFEADVSGRGIFFKHLGIYAYRRDFLMKYVSLPPTELEKAESLEQLRVISNGYKIRVSVTPHRCHGIDTPEDFRAFLDRYMNS